MVQIVPSSTPSIAQLAAHDPNVVLDNATTALVQRHGLLDPAMLSNVRRAAVAAPLDARSFLILGHQQILDGEPSRAVATLEAGQRLDPRQRLIHLLLVDRYLRTGDVGDATAQFSVMARLGGAGPIAPAIAQMSVAPDTRDAVRRVLRSDPNLEQDVLVDLAKSDASPTTVFDIASPNAKQSAGGLENWGLVLINRLVEHGDYVEARRVWQRVYRLSDTQVAAALFNANFQKLAAAPPFNWLLIANGVGAADMRNNSLSVDYYGRENGDLASQILVLPPGSYQFSFKVEGSKTGAGPTLAWVLRCASGSKADLMRINASGSGQQRFVATRFNVPPNCPAQRLAFIGEAGDFPATIDVTMRDLSLRPAPGSPQ